MNRLLLIKITVFVFTFLLIFGTLILAGRVYKNIRHRKVADIVLNQPQGSEIRQITAGNGELYILTSGGDTADRVIVYDAASRKIVSNIVLN